MKVSDALRLNDWVRDNRTTIIRDKNNRAALCDAVATALEFKVSDASMKAALVYNKIETKNLSKHQRVVQSMESEIKTLRTVLIKVVTASNVPEWLREELLTEDLHDEVKACLRSTLQMANA